jgi:hypothetical protein
LGWQNFAEYGSDSLETYGYLDGQWCVLLTRKIVDFFTMFSDQRERVENQPSDSSYWLASVHWLSRDR